MAAAVDVMLLTLPATTDATTAVVAAAPTVEGVRRAPQAGSVGAPLTAAAALAAPPQVTIKRYERRSIRQLLPTRGNSINTWFLTRKSNLDPPGYLKKKHRPKASGDSFADSLSGHTLDQIHSDNPLAFRTGYYPTCAQGPPF